MKRPILLINCLTALILTSCGGGGGNGDVGAGDFSTSAKLSHASNTPDTNFASKLERCTVDPVRNNRNGACSLTELPLLGQETNGAIPTINQIMHRTLISDNWMKNRLQQVLTAMPIEARGLFRSVTAIIIARDIRPAFYTRSTGAIYIDPYYLFVTQAERDTIDAGQDFRSGFDDELKYDVYFRYMSGTERAYTFFPPNGTDRSANDLKLIFSRIMFHELGHANDFFPAGTHRSLNTSHTPSQAASANQSNWISTIATGTYPLNNALLDRMARVKFAGSSPTTADHNTTASDIATAINDEPANHDYPYLTQFEDVALLIEAALMDYFYNVEYEFAVLNRTDQTIVWGKRKRIAKANVKEKSRIILNRLLPSVNFSSFLASRTAEEDLPTGRTWAETNSATKRYHKHGDALIPAVEHEPFIK